jgi:hypothetical protein
MPNSRVRLWPATALALPTLLCALLAMLTGCASLTGAKPVASASRPKAVDAVPTPTGVNALLELRSRMASSSSEVQAETLAEARVAWEHSGRTSDGLAYAVALGAPDHLESNPVEAGRLLNSLLLRSPPDDLSGDVRRLAELLRGEYAARTALYAEIGRQKEVAARELRDTTILSEARIEDLNSDLARTRRERDEARRKLQAITDMERQLIEKEPEPARPEGSR